MERPIRNESKGIGGLVLIVLAAFALIIIAASGIGRSVVNPGPTATPAGVKPPTAPTQTAPVNPSPNVPPKAPVP